MAGIFYTCYCDNTWVEWVPKSVSSETGPQIRKLSCHSYRGSNPWPFNQESGALPTLLSQVYIHCKPVRHCSNFHQKMLALWSFSASEITLFSPSIKETSPLKHLFCQIIITIDRFYIALLSTLKQTHCTQSCHMWFWMSDCSLFTPHLFIIIFIHQSGVLSAIWLLHGWCHVKLLLSVLAQEGQAFFRKGKRDIRKTLKLNIVFKNLSLLFIFILESYLHQRCWAGVHCKILSCPSFITARIAYKRQHKWNYSTCVYVYASTLCCFHNIRN